MGHLARMDRRGKRIDRGGEHVEHEFEARARGTAGLTRRRFAALAGLAPAAVGAGSPGAAHVDAFRQLSAALTGFPVAALDREFARDLLQALAGTGRGAAVNALIGGGDMRGRDALETEIVSAWYSGLLPGETGPVVATVRTALVWRVLGFATIPGACAPGLPWTGPPPGEDR